MIPFKIITLVSLLYSPLTYCLCPYGLPLRVAAQGDIHIIFLDKTEDIMKTTLLKAPALSAVLGVMSTTTITQKPISLKFSPVDSDHGLMAYMLVVNKRHK